MTEATTDTRSAAELYTLSQQAAAAGDVGEARRLFGLAEQAAGFVPLDTVRAALAEQAPAPAPAADQAPPAPAKKPRPPQRQAGGRPRLPDAARTESRSIRLNEARWLKLRALGMDWLAKQIDRAHDPRDQAAP